ncbi:alpha/beta fold hydrolase [Microvirga roseola]|uniref:alpha/beta fold hydrolase n=1 Tax=Microvirga roseola TaxID=2883126 RepID=UPI001E5D7C6F|nr:alpha/beta hydrolase [Microvirga roseola]
MSDRFDPSTPGARYRVNGVTLHCVEAGPGDGPLVILLHGFPEFWWGWRRQIAPLAEAGFRVLVPDQRGYHLSDKPEGRAAYGLDTFAADVVGLIGALGRETCCLVGHDWGGLVAWWTATRHPERIAKLAAINAPHPSVAGSYMRSHPTQMFRSLYVGFFQIPRLPEAMLAANGHSAMIRALVQSSRPGTFPEEDLEPYRKAWSKPGALTAMINWYRALPLAPRLSDPRLAMPVRVLWGMRDRFLEEGLAEASLALCERGEIRRFQDATHWVHLEEADAVNAELIGFFRS